MIVYDVFQIMLALIDEAREQGITDGLYLKLCDQLQLIRNMFRPGTPSLSSAGSVDEFNFEGVIWRRHSF